MDHLQSLRVFVRVVDSGSFTRAADQLQLPRSTVSTAVQALEARLGTRLLHRTTRKVNLTHDGSIYYARAQRLLADFEEAESLFRPTDAPPAGKVRVDVPARVGRLILAPALPDFFARYPQIDLEIGVTDRPVDLVEAGVDCVVRVGELADSRLVARRLGELRQINCASPDYLERHGVPLAVADLKHHLAVNYASPLSGKIDDWEFIDNGRSVRVPMRGHVSVNNAEAYIACCLAGLGLIQIPAYDVQEDLASGRLVEVLSAWQAASMPICVLYPHRQHRSRRVQAFVEWAAALLVERMMLKQQQ